MKKAKKKRPLRDEPGWVSLTRAGIMLKVRYLKARDLMTQGLLGEVQETSGRYYVREAAVEAFRKKSTS